MTSKYTISTENGAGSFDLYALERDGLNKVSGPFQILAIDTSGVVGTHSLSISDDYTHRFVPYLPSTTTKGQLTTGNSGVGNDQFKIIAYPLVGLLEIVPGISGTGYFVVTGNKTVTFSAGVIFDVITSAYNDGLYTVTTSTFDAISNRTTIKVASTISSPSSAAYGFIALQTTYLPSALTVVSSTYEAPSVSYPFGRTLIVVAEDLTALNLVVPYGHIIYEFVPSTPMYLPGKGVQNYGQDYLQTLTKVVENFAANGIGNAPNNPLTGQVFYDTSLDQYQRWNGSSWALGMGGNQILSINGQSNPLQLIITGTTGTDFNIAQTGTDTNVLNLPVADATNTGKLSNTDWSTFNNKQNALTFGNLTELTSSILTITGGTSAVIGSGASIAVSQSDTSNDGYLSSIDWNTFNNKQDALTISSLTETTSSVLNILGGDAAVLGGSHGYQIVDYDGQLTPSYATGIATYIFTATVTVDGVHVINLSVDGNTNSMWSQLLPTLDTQLLPYATATINSAGNCEIISSSYGASSSINIVDTGTYPLFSNLLPYQSILSAVAGANGVRIEVKQANTSQAGYLSSADWNTFYNKQNSLSAANGSTSGYLTSTDWNTFNNKQNHNVGTANRVLISDGSGNINVSSGITTTELNYLSGASSNLQTQINSISSSTAVLFNAAVSNGGNNYAGTVNGDKVLISFNMAGLQYGVASISVTFSWGFGGYTNSWTPIPSTGVNYVVFPTPSLTTFAQSASASPLQFKITATGLSNFQGWCTVIRL